MNTIDINDHNTFATTYTKPLFDRMEMSLRGVAKFSHKARLAKTIAPIISDKSSNHKHLETIRSNKPNEDKVIAILMLGFPKNQALLPTLQDTLLHGHDTLKTAAIIAISQMNNGCNSDSLIEVLLNALKHEEDTSIKNSIKKAILSLLDEKTSRLFKAIH